MISDRLPIIIPSTLSSEHRMSLRKRHSAPVSHPRSIIISSSPSTITTTTTLEDSIKSPSDSSTPQEWESLNNLTSPSNQTDNFHSLLVSNTRRLRESVPSLSPTSNKCQHSYPQRFHECQEALLSRFLLSHVDVKRDITQETQHYLHHLRHTASDRLYQELQIAQDIVDTLLALDDHHYPKRIFRLESNLIELNSVEQRLHTEFMSHSKTHGHNFHQLRCNFLQTLSPITLANLLKRFLRNSRTSYLLLTPVIAPLVLSAVEDYASNANIGSSSSSSSDIMKDYRRSKLEVCLMLLMKCLPVSHTRLLTSLFALLHRIHIQPQLEMSSQSLARILSQSFFPIKDHCNVVHNEQEEMERISLTTMAVNVMLEMGERLFHYPMVLCHVWRRCVKETQLDAYDDDDDNNNGEVEVNEVENNVVEQEEDVESPPCLASTTNNNTSNSQHMFHKICRPLNRLRATSPFSRERSYQVATAGALKDSKQITMTDAFSVAKPRSSSQGRLIKTNNDVASKVNVIPVALTRSDNDEHHYQTQSRASLDSSCRKRKRSGLFNSSPLKWKSSPTKRPLLSPRAWFQRLRRCSSKEDFAVTDEDPIKDFNTESGLKKVVRNPPSFMVTISPPQLPISSTTSTTTDSPKSMPEYKPRIVRLQHSRPLTAAGVSTGGGVGVLRQKNPMLMGLSDCSSSSSSGSQFLLPSRHMQLITANLSYSST